MKHLGNQSTGHSAQPGVRGLQFLDFTFIASKKKRKKILRKNTALLPQPCLEETGKSLPTHQRMQMPAMKGELTGGSHGDLEGNASLYLPTPSEVDAVSSHYLRYRSSIKSPQTLT